MTRAEHVTEVFRRRYIDYQYHFVEFLAEHLADVSRTFKGDMQAVVVMAYVGQIALNHHREQARLVDPSYGPSELPGITASRLADVTGIPRATVRRKLVALERKGWLDRVGTAWRLRTLGDRTQARVDLADLDDRALERVARFVTRIEPLLTP